MISLIDAPSARQPRERSPFQIKKILRGTRQGTTAIDSSASMRIVATLATDLKAVSPEKTI